MSNGASAWKSKRPWAMPYGRLWSPRSRTRTVPRRPHEWTILELAHHLQIPHPTLYAWVYKGRLKARRTTRTRHPLWLVHADPTELARLRALRPNPALVRTKTPKENNVYSTEVALLVDLHCQATLANHAGSVAH